MRLHFSSILRNLFSPSRQLKMESSARFADGLVKGEEKIRVLAKTFFKIFNVLSKFVIRLATS